MTLFVVAAAVLLVVMVTGDTGILQLTGQVSSHSRIRIPLCAGEHLDAGFRQSALGAAAQTAADQHFHPGIRQHTRQRAMAAAVGADHLRGNDLAVLHLIHFEILGFAKVLKNLTVVIGYRNFH